jgi:hypothetical protein
MTAGHSLGGGLAQTAAYVSCGAIQTVFAFDSSPVTKHRAGNPCPPKATPRNFYRVFEQSEILSYVRFLLRMALGLKKADPHMMEIKMHLFRGVFVRAHNMRELAVGLERALRDKPDMSKLRMWSLLATDLGKRGTDLSTDDRWKRLNRFLLQT